MIALALVTACSIPLLKGPFLHLRLQIQYFNEIDMQLESERLLGEIKEKLFSEEITWKDICRAQKSKIEIFLNDTKKRTVGSNLQVKCYMKSSEHKESNNDGTWAKLRVEISFYKNKKIKTFYHNIVVVQQKEAPSSSPKTS